MTYTILHDLCAHQDAVGMKARCNSNPEEMVQVDDHDFTPLHLLCFRGPSLECLDIILSTDSRAITMKDRHGNTPLHLALKLSDVSLVAIQRIVSSSPGVLSVPNKEGLLPLHTACRFCSDRFDIIELLVRSYPSALKSHIKLGSTLKAKEQRDALKSRKPSDHITIPPNHKCDSFELGFRDDEVQIRDGAYPIHMALHEKAKIEVIEFMVSECLECLGQIDKFGKTPLDVAKDAGYSDCRTLSLLNPREVFNSKVGGVTM